MNYYSFKLAVYQERAEKEHRLGQAYFNVLKHFRPDLAEQLRGSRIDPFHKDHIPVETEEFVATNWGDDENDSTEIFPL